MAQTLTSFLKTNVLCVSIRYTFFPTDRYMHCPLLNVSIHFAYVYILFNTAVLHSAQTSAYVLLPLINITTSPSRVSSLQSSPYRHRQYRYECYRLKMDAECFQAHSLSTHTL